MAASRLSRPVAPGSSGGVGGGTSSIDPTILDLAGCADDSRRSGRPRSWPRSSAPSRSSTIPAGTTTSPRPTRRWSSSSARNAGRSPPIAGASSPTGPTEAKVGFADVQRPRGDDHHEPGVPRRVRAQALPRPGRFVLRMAARGQAPPPVPGRAARRTAARPGRPVGGLARPGDRDRPADVHDHHDHAERRARRPPRPDAGGDRRGRLGSLAGPGPVRPRRAGGCSGLADTDDGRARRIYPGAVRVA